MPKVNVSNGIRPEFRALSVIKLNVPVSPKEIEDFVGTGPYAAKYISFLRRDGFVFDSVKDGRAIVSYTLIKEPDNADYFRNMVPKVKAPKVVKVPKQKTVTVAKIAPTKAKVEKAAKKVVQKAAAKKDRPVMDVAKDRDEVEEVFGTSGEIASSYSVDGDWDEVGDLSDLIR